MAYNRSKRGINSTNEARYFRPAIASNNANYLNITSGHNMAHHVYILIFIFILKAVSIYVFLDPHLIPMVDSRFSCSNSDLHR